MEFYFIALESLIARTYVDSLYVDSLNCPLCLLEDDIERSQGTRYINIILVRLD